MGVTSLMAEISRPAACSERIAASRPAPGPLTQTSTRFMPRFNASRALASAATCAANGVLLREPLNPTLPALAQVMTWPSVSVMVTIVLLKLACTCATPVVLTLRSRLRVFLTSATQNPPFRPRGPAGSALLRRARLGRGRTLHPARGLLGTFAGAGVGLGALAPDRQPATVTEAPVGADIHQPLDVHLNLAAQRALHLQVALDDAAQLARVLVAQTLDPDIGAHPRLREDLARGGAANAEDVGERDLDALVRRKIDARDACHG